jgi:hypothetical protein
LAAAAQHALLVTETQVRNEPPIPFKVCPLQVFEESPTTSDHLEEAAAAMVVFLVLVEVGPKIVDPGRKKGNLDGSAAPILFVDLILLDDFLAINGHLVRASAGVYAAGEAPPRMCFTNVLAN